MNASRKSSVEAICKMVHLVCRTHSAFDTVIFGQLSRTVIGNRRESSLGYIAISATVDVLAICSEACPTQMMSLLRQ